MELRQLHYFLAVAEELNFSRAAERMLITQPPLSLQIQNLEKEMGVQLFKRNNRVVELTEAGKLFYEEVKKITNHLHRAVEDAKRTHHGEIGTLRVGFVGSATYDLLPKILRKYRQLYPKVKVQLFEMSTPSQIAALHAEEIDVGVLRPPITERTLQTEILANTPCVLAVPRQHPLLKMSEISISDLQPYPFVMLSRETWADLYDKVIEFCDPEIQQEAFEFQTVIGLVAGGLGIAVVPQSAMQLHRKDVEFIELNDPLPFVSMGITWRRNNPSTQIKAFIQLSKEIGGKLDKY